MVLHRGKFAVGFIVLFTLGVWVGIAFVFKLAVLDYPYVQLGYFILLAGLVVVGLVFARYTNELGRVEVEGKVLTAHRLLGKPLFSIHLKDIEGFAIAEGDSDVGAVYNMIIRANSVDKYFSLWGLSGQRFRLVQQIGNSKYQKELLKVEARMSFQYLGGMLLLMGLTGFAYLTIVDLAAGEPPGEIARFDVPVTEYEVKYTDDGDWTITTLKDAYANDFVYEVDEPYFTEVEMESFVRKLNDGPPTVSIWTYDRAFRRKVRNEDVPLGFFAKHYKYDYLPVMRAGLGSDLFGDPLREKGGDSSNLTVGYVLAAIGILGGGFFLWLGGRPRLRKVRFSERGKKTK